MSWKGFSVDVRSFVKSSSVVVGVAVLVVLVGHQEWWVYY
jgi:hypothetical protein